MNVNRTKHCWWRQKKSSNRESLPEQLKRYLVERNRRQKLSLVIVTWKVLLKSALKGIVIWLIKRHSSYTRSLYHVSTTISSQRKNWKRWENCQKHAFKLSWYNYIRHENYSLVRKQDWHEQSQNGQEPVTNAWLAWYRTFHTRVITDSIAMWVITAQHCGFGLLQESDFAGDLEDLKSISGGILCILRSRTFVPISWMCKKQTSTVPLNLRLFL